MSIPTIGPYGPDDIMPSTDMNELIESVEALYATPNLQGVLEFPEMSVAHVNGVGDNYAGIASPVTGGTAAAAVGGNLSLTPVSTKWKTLPFKAIFANMQVLSNVVVGDMTAGNPIIVNLVNAQIDTPNNVSTGNARSINFATTGVTPVGSAQPNGPQNNPLEVGDTATLKGFINTQGLGTPIKLGLADGSVSNYYFTFDIFISASAATKTYKFKIYLAYGQ